MRCIVHYRTIRYAHTRDYSIIPPFHLKRVSQVSDVLSTPQILCINVSKIIHLHYIADLDKVIHKNSGNAYFHNDIICTFIIIPRKRCNKKKIYFIFKKKSSLNLFNISRYITSYNKPHNKCTITISVL